MLSIHINICSENEYTLTLSLKCCMNLKIHSAFERVVLVWDVVNAGASDP